MKTIYKYTLTGQGKQTIVLPAGALIISAACQHGDICLYAMVDTEQQETIDVEVGIAGTGWELDDDIYCITNYFTTVEDREGGYVWHIFGRNPAKTTKS